MFFLQLSIWPNRMGLDDPRTDRMVHLRLKFVALEPRRSTSGSALTDRIRRQMPGPLGRSIRTESESPILKFSLRSKHGSDTRIGQDHNSPD